MWVSTERNSEKTNGAHIAPKNDCDKQCNVACSQRIHSHGPDHRPASAGSLTCWCPFLTEPFLPVQVGSHCHCEAEFVWLTTCDDLLS